MKNRNKKGFTLVELVVVIAVIAILAGVLIGTFTSVISRANQSKAVQEWKAAVDEAYVEYVAEYKKTPTSVKVEGKTITFGGTEVYADDRFVNFYLLNKAGYVTLDSTEGQQVYLNWDLDKDKATYSVATTKTVETDLLANDNTYTITYMQNYVNNALVSGAKWYKLDNSGTTPGNSFVSIVFSSADSKPTDYTAEVTDSLILELGTHNGKTWEATFSVSETTVTADVLVNKKQ